MAEDFKTQLEKLRKTFESGVTRPYTFRLDQLRKLKRAVLRYEEELYVALQQDLKKSPEECWVTELGFVISELNHCLKNLRQWMKPARTSTNLLNFPSSSFVLHEPLGVVLLIAPWNYPLQLLFTPLVGAIAAGNCVVLKPSEFAPATARVMGKIISENFSPDHILFVQGDGAEVVPALMNSFRFNHVFYTGSTGIGKKIYQAAAAQLVPVTLELGGKSPCVVESDANLKVAARRIAVTKFSNAGQMCVAPDYILVHRSVKSDFIELLKEKIEQQYSSDPSGSYNYGKIINEKQFDRLVSYVQHGEIIAGGRNDRGKLYIEPTLVEIPVSKNNVSNPLLSEEIFGPVLPIIPFDTFAEAKSIIDRNPDPLAFYVFTSDKNKEEKWLESVSFGGGCVNNASWHLTNPHLPFGGRGNSGIGNYHGQHSFEIFSHAKGVMKTPTWFDPSIKYPPFKGKLGLFKRIIR
ncbi:MAG TPA: aldehyde dehydrogenase [Chitinophagaceae bacterium]|nr:aldehyde dehydrogenase [Chitinophagaceae bacterium]